MTLPSEAHPQSVNGRLAEHLSTAKETILNEWLVRVRADPQIAPTDSLDVTALRNHIPHIFDDLIDSLRRYGSEAVADRAVKDAEVHGATRLKQGYQLTEMLREMKHLRAVLILQLRTFEELSPDDGMAARLFIATTLHDFLDEVAIQASEEYLWAQKSQPQRSEDPLKGSV
jgi:hypothetical protein